MINAEMNKLPVFPELSLCLRLQHVLLSLLGSFLSPGINTGTVPLAFQGIIEAPWQGVKTSHWCQPF